MEKQNKKRGSALSAILFIGLLAVVGIGVTLAYLTDRDYNQTVAYTVNPEAFLHIDLREPTWELSNDAQPGHFDDRGRAIFSEERSIIKDPEISVAEGSVDCYVRLLVYVDKDLAKLMRCPPYANDIWIIGNEDNPGTEGNYWIYEYYYPEKMKQNQTTPSAFRYINFINPHKEGKLGIKENGEKQTNQDYVMDIFGLSNTDNDRTELDVRDGDTVGARDIKVRAEAVQADAFEDWKKVDWVQVGDTFTKQ